MIPSVKAVMVVVLLQPFSFSPNLFCSTSLLCSTYFMQVERMVEVDQAVSCKPFLPTKYYGPSSTTTIFRFHSSNRIRTGYRILKVPLISQKRKDHLD